MESLHELSPIQPFGEAASSRPCAPVANVIDRISPAHPLIALETSKKGGPYVVTPNTAQTDDPKQYVIEVDMPGVADKDVQVRVTETTITVEGLRLGPKSLKSEIASQLYRATIQIPPGADASNTRASFKSGVLEISIPKLPGSKQDPKGGRVIKLE